jgi:CHAT domain-containing protein/Tfp pilus assembly protein PilF
MFDQATSIANSQGGQQLTSRRNIRIIKLLLWTGLLVSPFLWPGPEPTQGSVGAAPQPPSVQESVSLEPGKPVERVLSGGQAHSYKIAMMSGQYLSVVVAQQGIDVGVTLFSPDGKQISEADSEHVIGGSETVSAIAEDPGAYLIEVRSPNKMAETGSYEIKVEELRTLAAEDKYRVAGELVFREAEQLQRGTLETKKRSVEKYQEALELYRRADDRSRQATTLNNISEIYRLLGEPQKAMEKLNEALPLSRAIGDRKVEAETLNNIGLVCWFLGDPQKAMEKYNEALLIRRAVSDRRGEAATLNNIGLAYRSLGDPQKAMEKYNEALLIRRAVSDRRGEATTLNNIGILYWSLGEPQKAMEKLNKALLHRRAIGDRNDEAMSLTSIGLVYKALGEIQKALEKYYEALPILHAVGDRHVEAITLINIGALYHSLGELQKALEMANEALPLFHATGNRSGEAVALGNIGAVYRDMGEPQKALEKYNEALPIQQAIGEPAEAAATLNNIGLVYQALGKPQKALETHNETLTIRRAVGDRKGEAATLNSIGVVYQSLGEPQRALERYTEALPLWRAVGDRNGEADALLGIARAEQKRGNLAQARQTIEQAVGLIESLRTNIVSQDLRASYFAYRQEFFKSYIDVLMQIHKQNPAASFDAVALAVSERARARSLMELLKESHADIRQGVDGSLLEREHSLQQQLNGSAAAQLKLLNSKHTPEQAAAAAKEVAAITSEYEEIQSQIRVRSPRYASLTQPQPLGLREIQQQVLDPDTLLLEYSLGKERSYLWVVTQNSVNSYELPRSEVIEGAALHAIGSFSANNPAADKTVAEAATTLSQMILGPAVEQLGTKRLLVVADGILQYLPFGALPAPTRDANPKASSAQGGQIPLIVRHEIVILPSASTLALLRREQNGRQPAPKQVAVLADPVFDRNDSRLRLDVAAQSAEGKNQGTRPTNLQNTLQLGRDLERSAREMGVSFDRLGFSRREAEAIIALTPEATGLKALDFEASRATALSEELGQYRIVHFATHGLLNSQHPELSGLVLSLLNERGQPQDGFLRAYEVYNLKLNADLVVLSGCRTALGKDVKGEGLVGMTRGFMYAGAPRVVASLWQVSDKATADLMKRFYRGMLADGLRPSAALREAQVAMWKERRAPYFWAAFVIQGEWR